MQCNLCGNKPKCVETLNDPFPNDLFKSSIHQWCLGTLCVQKQDDAEGQEGQKEVADEE